MTEKDLLPCKNCGAKPVLRFSTVGGGAYRCPNCQSMERYEIFFDQETAILEWNKANAPEHS